MSGNSSYDGLGFEALVDVIEAKTGWERDWIIEVATPTYPCPACHGRGTVPAITEAKKVSGALSVLKVIDHDHPGRQAGGSVE